MKKLKPIKVEDETQLYLDVENVINRIRPYINQDGGDISLHKVEDGIVYVSLSGACEGCDMVEVTIYDGLERFLLENVPQVVGVKIIDTKEQTL